MSFVVECPSCGATSGPSVGVCPFCKSQKDGNSRASSANPTVKLIRTYFREGKLPQALHLAEKALEQKQIRMFKSVSFLMLYAKILLEVEAPSSRIREILVRAQVLEPQNGEIENYLEILQAKSLLRQSANDPGEMLLKDILRRDMNNPHALFMLGAHLYWSENRPEQAVRYLERCVHIRPCFLRAWGCLGTLYKQLGNHTLAARAFRRCARLETHPEMKQFFLDEAASA